MRSKVRDFYCIKCFNYSRSLPDEPRRRRDESAAPSLQDLRRRSRLAGRYVTSVGDPRRRECTWRGQLGTVERPRHVSDGLQRFVEVQGHVVYAAWSSWGWWSEGGATERERNRRGLDPLRPMWSQGEVDSFRPRARVWVVVRHLTNFRYTQQSTPFGSSMNDPRRLHRTAGIDVP